MLKKLKRIFPKMIEKSDIVSKQYAITNEKATFEEALQVYEQYLQGNEMDEKWKKILIYFYHKKKKGLHVTPCRPQ